MTEQNLIILSRHLFVLKRTVFFFSVVAETRLYHVLSRHFSLSLRRRMIAAAAFPFISNSYVQGTSRPPRNIFECFFFPVTLHLIVPPCTIKYLARQEMSLGRWPTVIPSFMTATLCLSPNFRPSGSGCVVSFSPITGSQ